MCGPCQPFSALSGARPADPSAHKLYDVTFGMNGSIISLTKKVLPHRLLTEQVAAFKTTPKAWGESPLRRYIDEQMAIKRHNMESHFAGYIVFEMDSKIFVESSRPRL